MALGAEETCDLSPNLAPTQDDEEGNPYFSVLFTAKHPKGIGTPVSHLSCLLPLHALYSDFHPPTLFLMGSG